MSTGFFVPGLSIVWDRSSVVRFTSTAHDGQVGGDRGREGVLQDRWMSMIERMNANALKDSNDTLLPDDTPRSIAPTPRLSGRGLLLLLLLVSLFPLISLSIYAAYFGRAAERELPVEVSLDKQPVNALGDQGSVLTDVVVIRNIADHEIPNLTVNLNGQYFLYQNSPLGINETLVLPQQIFKTKANQVFVPGRYRIEEVTVTGKLPSGARGVTEVHFEK